MSHGSRSPTSSHMMVFSKCGHLITETRGLCLASALFLSFRFFFFFFLTHRPLPSLGSKCQRYAAQSSHPSAFLNASRCPLKSYDSQSLSQWLMCVSCSRLNVASSFSFLVFFFFFFSRRLLSNTVPRRRRRRTEAAQVTTPGPTAVTGVLL